jgi:hypothetical protein
MNKERCSGPLISKIWKIRISRKSINASYTVSYDMTKQDRAIQSELRTKYMYLNTLTIDNAKTGVSTCPILNNPDSKDSHLNDGSSIILAYFCSSEYTSCTGTRQS